MDGTTLLYPGENGNIEVAHDKNIKLFCAAGFSTIISEVDAKCDSDIKISHQSEMCKLDSLTCCACAKPECTQKTVTAPPNLRDYNFSFKNGVKIFDVRFRTNSRSTMYTHYYMSNSIGQKQTGATGDFRTSDCEDIDFGKDSNKAYAAQELQICTKLLGFTNTQCTDWFGNNQGLAKGHLAAAADFPYVQQQKMTYSYFNAAPMWQKFNTANWKSIENGVRKLAEVDKLNLNIYTGTHEVLQLKNAKGVLTSIYLRDNNEMPVPKFFYKIVIDDVSRRGIVFVMVNHPNLSLLESVDSTNQLCSAPINKAQLNDWPTLWAKSKEELIAGGYSYACKVHDFLKQVDYLPHSIKASVDEAKDFLVKKK